MQHFELVNWRIRGFVFWCHEQVTSAACAAGSSHNLQYIGCKRERRVQEKNRVAEGHTIATQLWSFKLLWIRKFVIKAVSWGSITKFLSSESLVFIKEFKGCKRERSVQGKNQLEEAHTLTTQLWSFKLLWIRKFVIKLGFNYKSS